MPTWPGIPTATGSLLAGLRPALLTLSAALLLVACSRPVSNEIRMGLASAPLNLDPRYATDAASERINRLLYQRLVELDSRSLPVPGIARWERLTPRHYRFILTGAAGRFTHGRALDAWDVVATYRFVLDPANASPRSAGLGAIERIEALDGKRIDFFLSHGDPLFPAYLTLDILPADYLAAAHPFENRPVGSGRFAFVAWPGPGRLLLERRSDGQRVAFVEVKNPTLRVLKLLRGEIDLLQNDLSPELADYLGRQPGIRRARVAGSTFTYLGFNLRDPALSDLRVRRAVAHAIDRHGIIRWLLRGSARPAEGLFPPEHWAGNGELRPFDYDPVRARELLREAGYGPEHPLRLVYKTSSDPFRIRLATLIQGQLEAAGIRVDLRSYDWGTLFGDIKAGNFQLYSLSWVGMRTPDGFRYIFASDSLPPRGANRGGYANIRVDRLLQEAELAGSLEAQALRYRQVQELLHRDLPYVPLWFEEQQAFQGERIGPYAVDPDGGYDGLLDLGLEATREHAHVSTALAH